MNTTWKVMSVAIGASGIVYLVPFTTYAAAYKMSPVSITFNDKKVSGDTTVMGLQAIDPVTHKLTTLMPDWYITDLFQSAGIYNSWDGHNLRLTIPGDFVYKPMSPVLATTNPSRTNVYVNGVAVETPPVLTAVDPVSHKSTNYLPIWYFEQILNAMGITNVWHKPVWNTSWNNDGIPGTEHGLKYTKYWSGSSKITLANDPYDFGWMYFFDPVKTAGPFKFPYDTSFENVSAIRNVSEHQKITISNDEYQTIGNGEYEFFNGITIQPQGSKFVVSAPTFSLTDQFSLRILPADALNGELNNFKNFNPSIYGPISYSLDDGVMWVSNEYPYYKSEDVHHGGTSNPPSHVLVEFKPGTTVAIQLSFSDGHHIGGVVETLLAKYSNGKLILELGSSY